jgi:hypothetical protein
MPSESREHVERVLHDRLSATGVFEEELRLRRRDGTYRQIACHARRRPAANGAASPGGLGCGVVLGEPLRSPAERPGLPPALRHDLNNQLAIIRMMADVLVLTPSLPAPCAAKAREIVAAAEHATQLLRQSSLSLPAPTV